MDRLAYKIKRISALAGTGCQYSPDAFAPNPTIFATSALCNITVYNNKTYRLLSEIIGRFNAWCCDKSEISIAVFTKTICKILSLTTAGNIDQRNIKKCFSTFFHRFCKTACCKLFGLVKNTEHITHRIKQFLAIIGGGFIRKTRQIFKLSDKVSDTKLYQNIEVFHIFASLLQNLGKQCCGSERRQGESMPIGVLGWICAGFWAVARSGRFRMSKTTRCAHASPCSVLSGLIGSAAGHLRHRVRPAT